MIYKIYERFIELTENYRVWDYLGYIVFFVIVIICSLYYLVAYGQGQYTVTSNNLSYTITADTFQGNLALPPLGVSCDSKQQISLAFKVKVSNHKANAVLDIQLSENATNSFANKLSRLASTDPQIINYSNTIGNASSQSLISKISDSYPYSTERTIQLHGQFNKNMQLEFYDFQASTTDGKCVLNWLVQVH